VTWFNIPMKEKPADVMGVFGEKYGEVVRVVDIGGGAVVTQDHQLIERAEPAYSAELCGGTHVEGTGEIGSFKILSESAISAGTRRIEAVAGRFAFQHFQEIARQRRELAGELSCKPEEIQERFAALQEQRKNLEKQLKQAKQARAGAQAEELAKSAVERDGLEWIIATAEAEDPNALRQLTMQVANNSKADVVILGGEFGEKVTIVANCSGAANAAGIRAGDLIKDLAGRLGGKGGGKPDFAMGGAKNDGQLKAVLSGF
jgi:alanyl-tRNA synthetase